MAEGLERAINLLLGRWGWCSWSNTGTGDLKRIGESKYRFRNWLTGKG